MPDEKSELHIVETGKTDIVEKTPHKAELAPDQQMCSFHDRELATLTDYLLESVQPKNLHEQQAYNTTFSQLGLEAFIGKSGKVDYSRVQTRMSPYAVSMGVIGYIVEVLNGQMPGRTTRAIGAGSGFWTRLLTKFTPTKTEAGGRQAAVPTEGVPVAH